jgi:ADP-ribose pyrophosphatase YjhB (NUDIX family)
VAEPDPAFLASLTRVRAGAGALITDAEDKVLIVEPTYKPHWEVPGGIVEKGEPPAVACARELREELGLELKIGRLLVIEHQSEPDPRGDSVMFIYEGGMLGSDLRVTLPPGELKSFGFFAREGLAQRLSPRLARRIDHALEARKDGTLIELENGTRRA